MKKRKNDVPHRRAFKRHHGRNIKPGYHIHHLDGDPTNNDISNLVEVTPQEHFDIHYNQQDWGACKMLASVADVDPEVLEVIQREQKGIHHPDFDRSAAAKKIWASDNKPGRIPVTDGTKIIKFKTEDDANNFVERNEGWRRGLPDSSKVGLSKSKRRITSNEAKQLATRRMEEGTHNMLQQIECPHCGKSGNTPIMKRWHFNNCKKVTNEYT